MPRTIVRYSAAPAGERVPGLLEVLAQLPDPRRRRGRRYSLVFVLAVATVCALAGARNFLPPTRPREKIADQKPGNPIPLIHHLWHAGPGARFLPTAPGLTAQRLSQQRPAARESFASIVACPRQEDTGRAGSTGGSSRIDVCRICALIVGGHRVTDGCEGG